MVKTQVKPSILIEAITEQIEIKADNFTEACKETGPAVFICFTISDWLKLLHYNDVQDIEMVKTQVKPGILIEAYTEQIEITVDNFTAAWK